MTERNSLGGSHAESFDAVADDLQTSPQSLARAVLARRSEYVRPHRVKIKVGTWNVAACPGTDKDVARWFVGGEGIDQQFAALDLSRNAAVAQHLSADDEHHPDSLRLLGGSDIGLYILGLQEVVELNRTKEYMNRAIRMDNAPVGKWQAALEAAMPTGYQLVVSEQMSGLLLLIYASPDIAPTITNVSTKAVGTGLLGYFGNKGAVTSRLVLGETTRLVFVNSHLASGGGPGDLDRRCWDVDQILGKTRFDPVVHAGVPEDEGEGIGEEEFAFWFGDLNFRLDVLPGDDIRRILTLHTRGEYDLGNERRTSQHAMEGEGVIVMRSSESDDDDATVKSSLHSREQSFDSVTTLADPDDFPEDPSQDPTSLQATLDSLLQHDQLRRVMAQRKAFHDGWREGPITFLPTYKYDVGTTALFDSSEKKRAPSWCDRILFRTRRDKQTCDARAREERESKLKDEEMKSRGVDEDDDVLFTYNPDTDGDEQPAAEGPALAAEYDEYVEQDKNGETPAVTKEEYLDRIRLDIYTSHQRISSSDHKPIISVFSLDYDAVVPELKAKIHAEVARELDRAENEGRPTITLAMEGSSSATGESAIDFGDLGLLERKSFVVTIANTGSVSAEVLFAEKPSTEEEEHASTLNWLATSFIAPSGDEDSARTEKRVVLEPGDTILAHVEAQVSGISLLRALNDGQARLEDVLVLRVEGGRDHFLPVKAAWLPTCFGRSVDELIRIPDGGIRKFVAENDIQGSIPYSSEVRCSAPKELFKLTEAVQNLAERCVADKAMLKDMTLPHEVGWPFDPATWTLGSAEQEAVKADLVSALDKDAPLTEALPVELSSAHKLEVLSSILLLFMASLTDGLVPALLWAKLSTALPNPKSLLPAMWPDAKQQVLDVLSAAPNHNIAFVFLTSTVSLVAAELSSIPPERIPPGLGRRLSFRRSGDDGEMRRRMRERRYAEVLGPLAFRTNETDKAVKERERVMLEMFLSREAAS